MTFSTAQAERMRIQGDGQTFFFGEVNINTGANKKLSFADADDTFRAGIQVAASGGQMVGTSAANDFAFRSQSNMLFSAGGNTEFMRLSTDGTLRLTNGASGTSNGIVFKETSNADLSKYIKQTAYFMHYNGNQNEGHHFTTNDTQSQLKIYGDNNGTLPSSVDITANNGLYMNSTQVMQANRSLVNIASALINGPLGANRAGTNGAIWMTGGVDVNHALWNDYYGGPTTKGASNSGFDGMKWNAYRGLHLKGGSGGAYNIIVAENTSSNANTHSVKLYASNVLRLSTTTSGVTVAGTLSTGPVTSTGAVQGTYFSDGYIQWTAAQLNRYGSNIELQYTPTNANTTVKIGAGGSNPIIFNAYTGTADFSGKVDFQGTAAIEGGTGNSGYGMFKGYTGNYNHFMTSRGSVGGTNTSPSITGGHQMCFVEYIGDDSSAFRFLSSHLAGQAYTAKVTFTKTYNLFQEKIRSLGTITQNYSDELLKDFHGKITSPLEKLGALNGYYHTPNARAQELGYTDLQMDVGVSAQEVQAVMPEVVKIAPVSFNEDVEEDYLTVQYEKLVPLLIESIKEQQTLIESLTARIIALEE
jgi:hypothetical protein